MLQAEGVADRRDIVAGLEPVGVAERDLREGGRLDLHHRDVGARVAADELRRELALVEQRDGDLARVLDHVRIRDDVAATRLDDHAGAG